MNYGLRIDMLNARVDPQDIAAGPFTPARHYNGIDNVPNWKDVDPRVGAAYDLFGNGKTALKASIGRYVVADAYTIARAVNPEQATINTTTRTWNGTTTYNPFLDCNLANPLANGTCGPVSTPTFGTQVAPTTTYDPAITQGWGVRPYNWEMQYSVQQEVAPRVSVYGGYTRRWFGNLFATQNTAVTNASYTPYCITIPGAPAITGFPMPNGGSQQCGYFDLIRPTTPNNIVQSANNFGGIQDVYDGIDIDANARLSRGILLSGGVSFGRERTNSCNLSNDLSLVFQSGVPALTGSAAGIVAPRTSAYCDVHPPMQPNVKAQATYPFPGGVVGSLNFQSVPGAQINAQYPLTNTTPGLTLGRAFSSVAPTVDIVAPGTQYLDRIYQTDIRVTKNFKVGEKTTIRPTVSVYNLFNSNKTNTNAAYTTRYGSAWLAPTVILTPRFVDFGVQVDF